jgi:folylpolyglutamate synthase/dihydropteroate synthase
MWKTILKIDMGEARRLGDKYAHEDMEEAQLNRNMKNMAIQMHKDTEKYETMKERVEAKKSEIPSDYYIAMQRTLEFMKESVGTEQFDMQRQALLSLSREYNIFFRGE